MTRVEYDPNDPTWLNPHAGGEKFLSDQMMAEARVGRPKAKLPVKCPTPKTLDQLQHAKFPEPKILVLGLLVEGCAILAGRPKIGKSWLALDIAIAVAMGGTCLSGRQCKQGDVLYLALEDGDRRLQKRVTKLMGAYKGEWPKALSYVTQWPRMNEGGLDGIEDWIKTHPDARLVIIDVLARFRAPTLPKRPAYEQDYEAIAK
jgi:predicted ATP-dependent serine protease